MTVDVFPAAAAAAAAGDVSALCKDPAAAEWLLAELNTVGKENKVRWRDETQQEYRTGMQKSRHRLAWHAYRQVWAEW
jgi:hypothetical protein